MADTKISALTAGAPAQRTDILPAARGAGNVRLTVGDIQGPLNNLTASTSPTINDDSADGYAVGSRWVNATIGVAFLARDVTVGAAQWVRMDNADFWGYVSGRYYHGSLASPTTGSAVSASAARMHPITLKERVTISELAVRVTTAQSSVNIQLAIYAADPVTLLPTGLPLANTANISVATTGPVSAALGSALTLGPGLYWVGVLGDATTAVYTAYAANTIMSQMLGGTLAQIMSNAATSMSYLSYSMTAGTWGDVTGVSPTYGNSTAFAAVTFKVQ